jgi:hypothetical protein
MLAAQRFALAAGGRAWTMLGSRNKPEAKKMLVSRDESHQSAARFVGLLFALKLYLAKKSYL